MHGIIAAMETVWIIGAGRFGFLALERLSKLHRNWRFVIVDMENRTSDMPELPNTAFEHGDGIKFLKDNLNPGSEVSWIIPSLPVHMAFEWCAAKMGTDRLQRIMLPSGFDRLLPNAMRGENGDLYVSNANFICPSDCAEPADICTMTGRPRLQNMFDRISSLSYSGFRPFVLRSRQLGPGVGGLCPDQLYGLLNTLEHENADFLVATACRCHGVITGARTL